ncbi:Late embryogenesis abundant protein LEA-2 subgroup domain-containing protein [Dioscorea alata]|uniref:Late embryogenesis abundant protein LEA-2 subgroup domain-containing protein n=1 Tax=Dioscorea alata TaxID=55571 RepID=A0ACB7UNV6_DIOAL|nr:Late embryogenesis abundant protein LEA-2 subgroup domain-containing protein [Dioscorea alata]
MANSHSFSLWLLEVFALSGLLIFFLWLSLHPSKPTYTITQFSISDYQNNSSFTIEISNNNRGGRVYLSDINITIYIDEVSAGNTMLPAFSQRHERTTTIMGGAKIDQRVHSVLHGKAELKVGLVTKVKYKIWLWKSKLHGMAVLATLPLGRDGKLKIKKAKMHRRHMASRSKRKLQL